MERRGQTVTGCTVWALLFAVVTVGLRLAVLAAKGSEPLGPRDLYASLIGIPGHLLLALLPAWILFRFRSTAAWILAGAMATALTFANLAAFHYEAILGELPTAAVLRFLADLDTVGGSISTHAHPVVLLIETALVTALMLVAARWMSRGREEVDDRNGPLVATGAIVASLAVVAMGQLHPAVFSVAAPVPLLHVLERPALVRSAVPRLDPSDVELVQRVWGQRPPRGGADARFPLCSDRKPPAGPANGRSVILLVLESVGLQEMRAVYEGSPVMPALQRMARDNLSFEKFLAAGSRSSQAMAPLFAGIPSQPAANLLWMNPLPRLQGLPLALSDRGYRTSYFHGSDLSFEQQRDFLRMAGFSEIIEHSGPGISASLAAGLSDGEMFDRMQRWIEGIRGDGDQAFFGTLFTLSTHDPYRPPPGRARRFESDDQQGLYFETLAYLDGELERFYDWYDRNERQRGTYLVIVGDHVPLVNQFRQDRSGFRRFDVPLIIAGLEPARLAEARSFAGRRASQMDVPATIAALLGMDPLPCDQGVDLLTAEADWPADRSVHATGGDSGSSLFFWKGEVEMHLDLRSGRLSVLQPDHPQPNNPVLQQALDEVVDYASAMARVSSYLVAQDAFAPAPSTIHVEPQPLPGVEQPLFVSHRGNSGGPSPTGENSLSSIETAINAGFEWIEVDVNITKDLVPVVLHDTELSLGDGETVSVTDLTVDELRSLPGFENTPTLAEVVATVRGRSNLLLEAKPQSNFFGYQVPLAEAIAETALEFQQGGGRVIVDSFSQYLATRIGTLCDCPTALDYPRFDEPPTRRWFEWQRLRGIDWVYLHENVATPEVVASARGLGLKVMVYTVNDPTWLERRATGWPDGIITDTAAVAHRFSERLVAGSR